MNIRLMIVTAVLAASVTLAGAAAPAAAPTTAPATASSGVFKTQQERIAYALGLQFGERLKGMDIEATSLAAGIRDAAGGKKPQLTEKEIDDALEAFKTMFMARQEADMAADVKAGETFLVENGKKEGVKTTASGLQYKVIKSGTGKSPKASDSVTVNYRGTLTNGKEFDASKTPISFGVDEVIPGWTEALQLMKEGDKWQLVIPSKLAYGTRGAGPDIGPNAVLVFEVELLQVKSR